MRVLHRYARQVASGMAYLHEDAPTTIIHRDLKSLNVLVSKAKECKITDFGMARAHVHTTNMSGAGTAAWMAPEVIRSGTYVDIPTTAIALLTHSDHVIYHSLHSL